jgi:hypothetical protein
MKVTVMELDDRKRYQVAFYDRCWYWTTVKQFAAVTSQRRALGTFAGEATRLIELVDDVDFARAAEPVRVARLMGMEPCSCEWSMIMILDHLDRFNRDMIKLIHVLTDDQPIRGTFSEDAYEPDADVDGSIVSQFETSSGDYLRLVQSKGSSKTRRVFRHPWLGPMNAHQWNCWTAAHMRIHRRHAMKIMSVAGVL